MTVQNFMEMVWIVFEKFEIFIGGSGEKNVTIAKVQSKIFPDSLKISILQRTRSMANSQYILRCVNFKVLVRFISWKEVNSVSLLLLSRDNT